MCCTSFLRMCWCCLDQCSTNCFAAATSIGMWEVVVLICKNDSQHDSKHYPTGAGTETTAHTLTHLNATEDPHHLQIIWQPASVTSFRKKWNISVPMCGFCQCHPTWYSQLRVEDSFFGEIIEWMFNVCTSWPLVLCVLSWQHNRYCHSTTSHTIQSKYVLYM